MPLISANRLSAITGHLKAILEITRGQFRVDLEKDMWTISFPNVDFPQHN